MAIVFVVGSCAVYFLECTLAGILKLACSRTLPFWWDDVSDFTTLKALAVQTFNQVNIYRSAQFYPFLAVNLNFCSMFFY